MTPRKPISEREQSLLDMASLERVEAGRNRGKDARNSDGQSSSEDGGYNGEGGVQTGGVVSSVDDGRKLNMVRTEIPSSTQGSESQSYSQQQRVDDHDAPPSSQPRPVSSEGEDEDDQDATMVADAEPGLIDFKTPFLDALLPQNSPRTQHDLLQIKTSVQDFAQEHPFWTQSILVEEEAVEFEKDVFEFAKAAGLTVNLAKVEVMRAMGKWKAAKGVRIGVREDRGSGGLGLGLPVNSIERGDEAGVERGSVERGSGNKRKRGGKVAERVGELVDAGVAQPSTKRQKRRDRKKRISGLAISEPNNGQDGTPTPKTKVAKVPEEVATSESKAKAAISKTFKEAATSESKAKAANSKTVEEVATSESKAKAMSSKTVKEVTSAKIAKMEKRRQKKLKAKQGPVTPVTSSHFPPKVYSLPNSTTPMDTKTGLSLGPQNAGKDKEVLENDIDKTREAVVPNSVAANGKKKRKRKRNKNSLPAAEVEAQSSKAARALAAADKSKQLTLDNISPPRTKKKRVRSRLSKVATATKAIEEDPSVPDATVDFTKSVVEPTHAELPAEPEEQPPQKSRNRRRGSRLGAENPPAPIATAAEAEPDTVPILSEEPAKKRTRDRGRKSLGKADVQTDSAEKPDLPVAPVTELPDTTFKKKEKKSKRDESRKRSVTMPDIQEGQASAGGESLLGHQSSIGTDLPEKDIVFDIWEKTRSASVAPLAEDDGVTLLSEGCEQPSVRGQSAPAGLTDDHEYRHSAAAVPQYEDEENVSVWSQTNYGPLDWDHSGDEFDKIVAKRKITRSSSSISANDRAKVQATFLRAFTPMKREPSMHSVSKPSCTKQERGARGRFISKDPSPTTNTKRRLKETHQTHPEPVDYKVRDSYSTGTVPGKTTPARQRDAKGRFVKEKPCLEKTAKDSPMEVDTEPLTSSISVVIPAKPKVKAPAKSPYFVPPPITPSKLRNKKATQEGDGGVFTPKASTSQPEALEENEDYKPSSQGSGRKRPPVSCIPFPPLSAPHFGLIQEKLADDPFRLLIAVTFLIRTHGKHAIPVFFELIEKYPTPESLATADKADIVSIIRHLGLQNQRASTYQTYAQIWLNDPPQKHKRYPVRGYPTPTCGKDVTKDEIIPDDDIRSAWEIGHMTFGPYALDSWRIFCRDKLRGVAEGWNGEGAQEEGFQPEWMRVLPEDKELRAYLRWMWLKEGFEWDPFTGEKEVAREELMRAAMEGRIAWDDEGGMRVLEKAAQFEAGLSQIGRV